MLQTLPSNYAAAAQILYEAGRADNRAGLPMTANNNPGHPDNVNAWVQTFKRDPALQGYRTSLSGDYGPVANHYFFGWKDQSYNWPDRGWDHSIDRGNYGPPIGYDGSHKTRLEWLYWLYTFGWMHANENSWALSGGSDPTTGVDYSLVGRNEGFWEFQQGQTDRKGGAMPPVEGYRNPSSYGIPSDAGILTSATAPPPTTSIQYTPQATNAASSGNNFLQTLLTFELFKKLLGKSNTSSSNDSSNGGIFGSLFGG